jgi:hypothetical protein
MEVGIPPAKCTGKNLHPDIIADTKELLFKILKRTFSRRDDVVLVGRPKYVVAENDTDTYIGIKHPAHETR